MVFTIVVCVHDEKMFVEYDRLFAFYIRIKKEFFLYSIVSSTCRSFAATILHISESESRSIL